MYYADMRKYDTVNAHNGIATSLFVSGCLFNCKGCFNKLAQSFIYGNEFTKEVEEEFINNCKDEHVNQVSFLGGDIFFQDVEVIEHLFKRIKKETGKRINVWTGFTIEHLMINEKFKHLLSYVDILVDGQYECDKRDLNLELRGSSNQRVIDVQHYLTTLEVIEVIENIK